MAPDDRCDLLCLDLDLAEAIRARRVDENTARRLAAPFDALSDPTRLTVALALRDAPELCVCDLAWIVGRSQNLVSHHLRRLRDAGLADYRRDGKMEMYALTDLGHQLVASIRAATHADG